MKNMRDVFGEALIEVGRQNENVVVVDSDVAFPTRALDFRDVFPDRFIQMGVAEQNTMSFAAGLSTLGYIPVVNHFSCFASRRAHDQILVDLAYGQTNVKVAAAYAGLTSPNTGATHQEQHDIAVMRSIPKLTVVEPADALELRQALSAIIEFEGPVYFRMSRGDIDGGPPDVSPDGYRFELGRGVILREGEDIALIGCGLMVSRCVEAAGILAEEGVSARVVNISTIKPLDADLVIESAGRTGAVVTAENHNILGGLGGAIAEVVGENHPVPIKRVGIGDKFGESAPLSDLFPKYGLTAEAVVEAAREVLARK
jgi:transketolase